jgi:diaminohydroxyphosphoribosylaminopyrimidine deaminase/5-amino-6-(5-phosphoribosylamino)uracil reductase
VREVHQQYLKQALALALTRKGYCAPNPSVGAVIVKQGKIIGSGNHWASGFPHAEVAALEGLTPEETDGATIYVTLEPCCHWGKTPPCIDRLIQYRFAKVIFGLPDPNPNVAGKGAAALTQAGILCEQLTLPEIVSFYESYQFWWKYRRPRVIAKLAVSLDGKIALKNGKPISLTGAAVGQFTHLQRRYADAILTTAMTIQHDDPALNVRLLGEVGGNIAILEEGVNPISKPIYILDSDCRIPLTAKIWNTASRVTIFHAHNLSDEGNKALKAFKEQGANTVPLPLKTSEISPGSTHRLDLKVALEAMGADGIHECWVEAGGQCFTGLLQEKLVQRAYIYVAPKCLGRDAWPGFPVDSDVFVGAKDYNWQIIGEDAVCEFNW